MPVGSSIKKFSQNLVIASLMSWTTLLAAAEVGEAVVRKQGNQGAAPGDVRFADGSIMPADGNAAILVGVPTLAPRRPAEPRNLTPLDPGQAQVPLQAQPAEPVSPQAAKPITPATEPVFVAPTAPAAPTAPPATDKTNKNGPLVPVPDAKYLGPVEVEVTSFHGITPGVSKREAVEKSWGKPKESKQQDNSLVQLYSVDPFPKVEVGYSADKVTSIIIRFDRGFPSGQVAEQLDLSKVQPVLVSNELGEVLGQAYPERGVLFSFEPATDPAKALKKVTHIVLEPITAEPFVLRAETNIDIRPEFSLHDAEQAIKLQGSNARAQWLRSRAMTALGQNDPAVAAAAEAARLDPKDARYQVTKAQTLLQAGHVAEAVTESLKAVELARQRPHVKARALCLLGDIQGAGAKPDFKQALDYHTQALQLAETLITSRHPAIRMAAKEVVLDAHLGALHDIAWGDWREKEQSAAKWLGEAANLALELIHNEEGSEEYLFRVSRRALTAGVGLHGKLDPARWAKEAVRAGDALVAAAPETARKQQIQWEISVALYDAMQIFQMRGDEAAALRQGELAISYLEQSGRPSRTASASYLLGRVYFRTGAIHAINRKDHREAVKWFEKAVPQLGKTPPAEAITDLGRLGDSFVSMGVSYWNVGLRNKALALTQHVANLLQTRGSRRADLRRRSALYERRQAGLDPDEPAGDSAPGIRPHRHENARRAPPADHAGTVPHVAEAPSLVDERAFCAPRRMLARVVSGLCPAGRRGHPVGFADRAAARHQRQRGNHEDVDAQHAQNAGPAVLSLPVRPHHRLGPLPHPRVERAGDHRRAARAHDRLCRAAFRHRCPGRRRQNPLAAELCRRPRRRRPAAAKFRGQHLSLPRPRGQRRLSRAWGITPA